MVNKSLSFSKEHLSQSEGSMTWWKEEAIGCLLGRFPTWCLPRPNIFPPPVSSVFHVLILLLISALILSAAPKGSKDLTLSLPKCLLEFCKVTLPFESVDEILWCDHSNESSLPVLSHFAICFAKCSKMKFANLVKICLWLHLAVKGLMIWHMLNGNQKWFTVEVSPGAYVTDKPSEQLHKH